MEAPGPFPSANDIPSVSANDIPSIIPSYRLAKHFERRAEMYFDIPVDGVVNASIVRTREVKKLLVFNLREVFEGNVTSFNFGLPNMYILLPSGNEDGSHDKLAAKSLWRAPTTIEHDPHLVQAGIHFVATNLPPEANECLRAAMQKIVGRKFATCVHTCGIVMEDAGFTTGSAVPLSSLYSPHAMLNVLLRDRLYFKGQPVNLQVVRTSSLELEKYALDQRWAEACTLARHADLALEEKARKSKFYRALHGTIHAPGKLAKSFRGKPVTRKQVVAPALPEGQEYPPYIQLRESVPGTMGIALRQIWGEHSLFEFQQDVVDVSDYLPETLKAFPQAKPSPATRLKKWLLFSRPVVKAIRHFVAPRYAEFGLKSEQDVYDMMRTHTPESPNKYNFVVTRCRIIIARTTVGVKFIDWVLCKHVLMSGYDPEVVFSGEMWKDEHGVIHISGNSGTYQPSDSQVEAGVRFFQAVLPRLRIVKEQVEIV